MLGSAAFFQAGVQLSLGLGQPRHAGSDPRAMLQHLKALRRNISCIVSLFRPVPAVLFSLADADAMLLWLGWKSATKICHWSTSTASTSSSVLSNALSLNLGEVHDRIVVQVPLKMCLAGTSL